MLLYCVTTQDKFVMHPTRLKRCRSFLKHFGTIRQQRTIAGERQKEFLPKATNGLPACTLRRQERRILRSPCQAPVFAPGPFAEKPSGRRVQVSKPLSVQISIMRPAFKNRRTVRPIRHYRRGAEKQAPSKTGFFLS